jgi:hypothetical protein
MHQAITMRATIVNNRECVCWPICYLTSLSRAVTLLLRSRKVPVSNLAPETGCHKCFRGYNYNLIYVTIQKSAFFLKVGVGLVPKRGCLLTLAYYVFPRWYEFGERRWNDIDRGKPKNSEKNLSQYHCVHHKSHIDWPGREPGPPRWKAGD